jgi:signal transduction histidine kinase
MKHYLKTGEGPVLNKRIEITAKRRSGEHFPVELTISPIRYENDVNFSAFVRDISETKKAQYELESTTSRLATLIRNLHTGILVEDENRNIALVNNIFCEIFNIPAEPDDMIGFDCSLSAEQSKHLFVDPDKFTTRVDVILKDRKMVINEELEMVDGRVFVRDYLPIFNNDRFLGSLWQYQDITKRKQDEKELEAAKNSAESANLAKSQFLANMSHEIRTPLNAIFGMTQLLSKSEIAKEHEKIINGLLVSSDNLLNIINDTLDLSKIEAGEISLEKSYFNIREMTDKIVRSMEYKAEEKNIDLITKLDENIDDVLLGDETRIKQVLINLVNNGIKFTETGKVLLEG